MGFSGMRPSEPACFRTVSSHYLEHRRAKGGVEVLAHMIANCLGSDEELCRSVRFNA